MADSGAEKKGRQIIEKELRNLNKNGKKKRFKLEIYCIHFLIRKYKIPFSYNNSY
jgi:hypothetical protein